MSPGQLQGIARRVEDGLLAATVLLMVLLAGLQIVLRAGFEGGIAWIEPALRTLVLWIGLLGAVTASRSGQHIRIDLLTRVISPARRRQLQVVACSFTTAVCVLLGWHSARFVHLEMQYPTTAFAGIPTWAAALILPLAFALIALRYALATAAVLCGREPFEEQPPW